MNKDGINNQKMIRPDAKAQACNCSYSGRSRLKASLSKKFRRPPISTNKIGYGAVPVILSTQEV
jgi:hypothetical protein